MRDTIELKKEALLTSSVIESKGHSCRIQLEHIFTKARVSVMP